MSHHQNWNDMSSSSEDQDSWFDDEKEEQQTIPNKPQSTQEPVTKQTDAPSKQQITEKPQESKTTKENEKPANNQRQQRRRVYPSDQELLNQYLSKAVDDPKAIKVTKCYNQDMRELVKNLKNAKVREVNESTFLLFFDTEQHLIDFFKQKMAKRYKFFFNMFEKRAPKEGDPRYRNRDENTRKERRPPRGDKDERNRLPKRQEQKPEKRDEERRKKRYQDEEDQDQKDKLEHKKKRQQRQELKQKKVYHPKLHFQIGQNSNIVTIASDSFQVHNVLQEINRRKLTKNFSRIIIKAPFNTFPKVSVLCHQIAKFGFFLEKEPAAEAEKQSIHDLILIEKGKNKTDAFYERYNEKKEIKQVPKSRLLGDKYEEYFKQIDKYNLNEIVKGFEENEYIKRLKDASQTIQKYWNSWKVVAEQDNIEVLLKLTNRIKKSTIYDIELKPSLRNEKALLTAELRQRPEKERRPKVDVSNVNNYLS